MKAEVQKKKQRKNRPLEIKRDYPGMLEGRRIVCPPPPDFGPTYNSPPLDFQTLRHAYFENVRKNELRHSKFDIKHRFINFPSISYYIFPYPKNFSQFFSSHWKK